MNLHSFTRRLMHRAFRSRPAQPIRKRLSMESLEDRTVPTTMFAATNANALISFDSATPGTIATNVPITGLQAGEFILGLDTRPATGGLYGLGITDDGATRTGRIYTIDSTTGAATQVGATPWNAALEDTNFWGFDFNPTVDRIRIISAGGSSYRVDPNSGLQVAQDTNLSLSSIDDAAYTNNDGASSTTTLYGIRLANDTLYTIGGLDGTPSPNTGQVFVVGANGIASTGGLNLDIEAGTNIARATSQVAGLTKLFTIDLATGAATAVGNVGSGSLLLNGLTTVQTALAIVGTSGNDTLVVAATGASSGTYSLNGGAAVPFAGIASFAFFGGAGSDTFTIDDSAAILAPVNGIFYHGGESAGDNDRIAVNGYDVGTLTVNHTGPEAGTIQLGAGSLISFDQTEPLALGGTAADVIINLPAAASNAFLEDDGTPANGISQLRSGNGTFETTTFANPTGSLTINRGNAADTLTLNALPDFSATLTAGSAANPFGSVTVSGAVSSAGSISLFGNGIAANALLTAATTVTLNAGTGAITTSGAGTDVAATNLVAMATTGIDLDTAVGAITASTTGAGAILIDELDGVTLTSVTTADGLIAITTGGATTATNVAASGAGRNATIIASMGDITVATVSSAAGNATLNAMAGSLVDDGNNATRISANVVTLIAAVDIGHPLSADIDTAANSIVATAANAPLSGNPGIWINERDGVTLTNVTTANGLIRINTGGTTIATNVVASGANRDLVISSPGDISAGTVTSNGGAASLIAANLNSASAGTITTANGLTVVVTGTTGTLLGTVNGVGATLNKLGTGTLTLAGANTYTGRTNVNAGTLLVNGSISSNATVTSPGIVGGNGTISGNVSGTGTVSPGNSPGTLNIGGNFTPGGPVLFEVNPPAATAGLGGDYDQIIVAGTVDLSGATLAFSGTNSPPLVAANQIATLIANNGANPIAPNGGFVQGATVTIGNNVYRLFYNGGDGNELVLVENSTPTTVYVDDSFAQSLGQFIPDADLGTAGNQPATFGINAFKTINLGLSAVANGGTAIVNGGTYAETVSVLGTRIVRITGPNVAGAVAIDSLSSAIGTEIQIVGTSTLTVGNASNAAIAGTITNGGSLIKQGTGTLTLSNANTYAGTTTVNAGTLQIGAGGATGTPGTGPIVNDSNIEFNRMGTLDVAGGISGTGTVDQLGSGTVTLSGASVVYTGATTVQNGILELRNNGNLFGEGFRSTIALSNNAIVWLTATAGLTSDLRGGGISGTGSVVKRNTGIVRIGTFAGLPALTYSGNTTVEGGSLELQGQAAGRGFDTAGNLIVNSGATFVLSGLAAQTSGNAARFGGLSGLGAIIGANATPFLEFGANTATFDGTITDVVGITLSLLKTGAGTQTLTGANAYTGTTTVNAGTLLVNGDDSLATGAVAVNNAGTLGGTGTLGGATTVNAGGTITGGTLGGVGTLTVASLAFNGGAFKADFNGNTSDTLRTAGAVNLASAAQGTFTVNSQTGATTGANVFTLIDKTGAGAIANPPLTGATESGSISINGVATFASYLAGDGNNFTLSALGSPNLSGAGNFVVRKDTTNGASNIQLLQGGTIIDERPLASIPAAGTYGVTATAASTLTVDYTNAPPVPAGPFATNINYTGFGTDSLTVTAGSFGKIAYNPNSATSETIQEFANAADAVPITTIAATGITAVSDTSTNTGIAVINFPNLLPGTGSSTVGTNAGATQFAGNLAPTTTFGNPATNLVVNLNAAGSLAVNRLGAAFNPTGGVRVVGSTGADAISLNGTGANDFASLDIASGNQGGDSVTFTSTSKITGLIAVTTGGTVAVTGSTTGGNITFTAGSTIAESGGGLLSTSGALTTTSGGGTTLGSANTIATFSATNAGGPVLLQNQIPLNLSGVAQTGGGNVSVTNADKLTVTGGVIADTGGIALNVAVNGIDLNAAASKVQTAGTVLLNPTLGGVTQTGASQGVIGGTVALTGAGDFALDNANNDAGAMFRAAVNGKLTFRDANNLTLDPLAGVSTSGKDVTLFAGLNFTAQNSGVVLVNAGAGAVRIVPGAGAVGDISVNFTYDAEVIGSSVTFGVDTPAPANESNRTSNNFKIAPSKNATIVAFGNNPTRAQLNSTILGDSFSPLLGDPNIKNLNLVLDPFDPNTTFSGTYFITMNDNSVRQLKFRQIETLGNLGYRAIVAQTGNQQYSIRLQKTVLIPQQGSVTGQALQSSPFVVSPTFISTSSTYTAPSLAFGDVNGDGLADLVIANGANDTPLVTVINGSELFKPDPNDPTKTRLLDLGNLPPGAILAQFYGFPDANGQPVFRGGLNVAVKSNGANVPGDIVLGPGVGGGPVVQVWGISNGFAQPKSSFFAFEPSFRGGVTVATGDYNGDGLDDIIVGTGPGGAPRVQVFNQGKSDLELPVLANFFAYDSNFRGGVFVAAGNFNGKDADGKFRDDIATAPGYGGGPHIQVFGNTPGGPIVLASFFAWNPANLNGLQTLGSNLNNGIGSISFGAPELLSPGVGDPEGRQELLVGSARGTALQLRRFTFAKGSTSPEQTFATPISLYDELTNSLFNGIPIRDPMTNRVLSESELFDGGSVAGFGG